MRKKPLTDKAGAVRELTRGDLGDFRPAPGVLPAALVAVLPKRERRNRLTEVNHVR
jgi:hypothetical protein